SGSPLGAPCGAAGPTEAATAAAVKSEIARRGGVLCRSLLSPRPFVMSESIPKIPAQTRKGPGHGQRGSDHDLGMRGKACGMRQLRGDAELKSSRSISCSTRQND